MAAELDGLRQTAAETANYDRLIAERYLLEGKLFTDPAIVKMYEDSEASFSALTRAEHLPDGVIGSGRPLAVESVEAYLAGDNSRQGLERYLEQKRFVETMGGYFATLPVVKVFDANRGSHRYGVEPTYQLETRWDGRLIHFLMLLKERFPTSVLPTATDGENALRQLATVNDVVRNGKVSVEDYYRLAPMVNQFFSDLEAAGPHRNERKIAAVNLLPSFFAKYSTFESTKKRYEELKAYLAEEESAFAKKEAAYNFITRPRFSTVDDRKSRNHTDLEYSTKEAKKKFEAAEAGLAELFAGLSPGAHGERALSPNPLAVSAEEKLKSLLPPDPSGLAARFELARREVAQLEVIKERYFSDSGLFGLARMKAKKGKLPIPEDYLDLLHEILQPPEFSDEGTGPLAAEAKLNRWRRYFAELGVTEADYLRLVEDLTELDRDPSLRSRVTEHLIPDWPMNFSFLDGMKKVAFTKVASPLSAMIHNPREKPAPSELLTPSSMRSSVGFYLDTSTEWNRQLDELSTEILANAQGKLRSEAEKISAEVQTAVKKGRAVNSSEVAKKISPALVTFVKSVDEYLEKLADHHGEGLLIQHSVDHHLAEHREALSAKRSSVIEGAEKLPEWQQEIAIKHVERDALRLSALEKVKIGFDSAITKGNSLEQSAEGLRALAVDFQAFLASQRTEMTREQTAKLLEQLKAIQAIR